MNDFDAAERYTLAAALVFRQTSRARDDIAEMFIRQVRKLHNKANEALGLYLLEQTERTHRLISPLRRILLAYRCEGDSSVLLGAVPEAPPENLDRVLDDCEATTDGAGFRKPPSYAPRIERSWSQPTLPSQPPRYPLEPR